MKDVVGVPTAEHIGITVPPLFPPIAEGVVSGRYCGGCGVTNGHRSDCPSLQRDSEAAALSIAQARIRELEAQVAEMEDRIEEFKHQRWERSERD